MKRFFRVVTFWGLALAATACGTRGDDLVYSGTLEWTEHAVGARVAGRVDQLLAEESQTVAKGQRLATLDRFAQNQKDFERADRVYRQGGGSEQSAEQARLAMEDQDIRSPVDGVVMIRVKETGEVVAAGSPVFVVGDPAAPWVRVFVPENKIGRLKIGQPAALRFDGLEKTFKGRVSFIAPGAEFTPRNVQTPEERVTQMFAVKVAVDDKDPALRPGLSADVTLGVAAP